MGGWWGGGGWEEKWGLKLTSAKVVVEVEAELGNKKKKRRRKCGSLPPADTVGASGKIIYR